MAEKDFLTPKEGQQALEKYKDTAQRYHDYFVGLYQQGKLVEGDLDFLHYQRAVSLEEAELVQPLVPPEKMEAK